MNLRFRVDQAEALRRGVDASTSTVTLEVNPVALSEEERRLLADRLCGVDVCQLRSSEAGLVKQLGVDGRPLLVQAAEPTFKGLMDAVIKDQQQVQMGLDAAIGMTSDALEQTAALEESRGDWEGNTTLSW